MDKYDFGGWATRNDLLCSDGRTIRKDAFKHNDGKTVPLVWNHRSDEPGNVLGKAILCNKPEGVYTYGIFNNTEDGQKAKELVMHGDISSLSIHANRLKQKGSDVMYGDIKEVSLVLAGANPGACIDSVIRHGEESEDEAIIYTGERYHIALDLSHSDEEKEEKEEKTIEEIFNTLTDEQKDAVYAIVGAASGGDDAFRLFADCLRPVVRFAEEENVILAVEPVYRHIISTPERAERLLDEIPSDHLRIILDAVNLIAPDRADDADNIIADAIRRLGDRVSVLHMKDYIREGGQNKASACGTGSMHYGQLLSFADKRDLPMTLENTTPENAKQARLFLEETYRVLKEKA